MVHPFPPSSSFPFLLVFLEGCAVKASPPQNHAPPHHILENCLCGEAPTLQMWFDKQGLGVTERLSESLGWGHDPPRAQDPHLRVMVRQGLAGMVHWHERA